MGNPEVQPLRRPPASISGDREIKTAMKAFETIMFILEASRLVYSFEVKMV